MSSPEIFETHGCVRVENFIDAQTIAVVSNYFENKIKRREWVEGIDSRDPTSRLFYYADPLIEVLLLASKDAVEEAVGRELLPTYSYSRIYQPGEALRPHIDRPSCEISVTVNVATLGDFSPIYTQYGDKDPEKHVLNPGDAVIYKGCDVMHWRQPLKEGQLNVQFMLHYVDKNGPNAAYAKDKRASYGLPDDEKRN
jgi:hypothetical protein